MTVKTEAQFVDVESVEVEIRFRTTVRDWRKLASQLGSDWPSWDFGKRIRDMLRGVDGRIDEIEEEKAQ